MCPVQVATEMAVRDGETASLGAELIDNYALVTARQGKLEVACWQPCGSLVAVLWQP